LGVEDGTLPNNLQSNDVHYGFIWQEIFKTFEQAASAELSPVPADSNSLRGANGNVGRRNRLHRALCSGHPALSNTLSH